MTDPPRPDSAAPPLEGALRAYFEATSGAHDPTERALAALAGGELSDAEAAAALDALEPDERAAWEADMAALDAIWADAEAPNDEPPPTSERSGRPRATELAAAWPTDVASATPDGDAHDPARGRPVLSTGDDEPTREDTGSQATRRAPASLDDARNARRRRLIGGLTTLALAAVALFVLIGRPSDDGIRFKGGPTAGAPDWSLQVGVKRGDERFVLGSGGTLRTDDQLGFFYSAAAAGHLMIAFVDADGAIVRLFPRDADAAKTVPAGREMRLDAGATLTGAEGCEWVVGALGVEGFDLEALAQDVRAAHDPADPCALELPEGGARSYRAVLIRR